MLNNIQQLFFHKFSKNITSFFYCSIFFLSACFVSCGGSEGKIFKEKFFEGAYNGQSVTLSQDVIFSPDGNMNAKIPEGWVIATPQTQGSTANVFAVVCDPEYRYMLTFTELPYNEINVLSNSNELTNLSNAVLKWRKRRYSGYIDQLVEPYLMNIKNKQFSIFSYTTDSNASVIRSAVFLTQAAANPKSKNVTYNLYECMLTQIPNKDKPLPSPQELAVIHKTVLEGIKW